MMKILTRIYRFELSKTNDHFSFYCFICFIINLFIMDVVKMKEELNFLNQQLNELNISLSYVSEKLEINERVLKRKLQYKAPVKNLFIYALKGLINETKQQTKR